MRARLLLLALPLAACGSDPSAVTVRLSLDSSTCSFESPEAVTLTCAATVGVWLRTDDGRYLGQACVDFGAGDGGDDDGEGGDEDGDDASGEGASLGSLPDLLRDVTLSTEETGAVSVEVAVYAGWSADQGCPPPDQALELDAPPEIVVSGRSSPEPLADSDGAVDIALRCGSIAPRPTEEQCAGQCSEDEEACLQGVHAEQCDDQFGSCVRGCEGEECDAICGEEWEVCLGASPDGLCTLDEELCFEQCDEGDLSCEVECSDINDACYESACGQVFAECVAECTPGEDQCATYQP
jgi:hypothetical protein